MRISKEQARANREKILDTAAGLFRRRGFDGIGVADLMKSAGFTHGGLYNHFQSKDELAAAAAELAFRKVDEQTAAMESVESILRRYLSKAHRDELETACAAATLGGEVAHQSDQIKKVFATGIETWIGRLDEALKKEGATDPDARRTKAVNLLATAVGAIVLARASSTDGALSEEILDTTLKSALSGIGKA